MESYKTNQLLNESLIKLYNDLLLEQEVSKSEEELAKKKYKTKSGGSVSATTVLKNPEKYPKFAEDAKKYKASLDDKYKDSDTDGENHEQDVKDYEKQIQSTKELIQSSTDKIKELEAEKKKSTDPSSFNKSIESEKSKIERSKEDIKELEALRKESKDKDIASKKGSGSDKDTTDTTDTTDTEVTDDTEDDSKKQKEVKGDKSPEDTKSEDSSNTDEIKKIESQIKKLESQIKDKNDTNDDLLKKAKAITDTKIGSNKLLTKYAASQRLKNDLDIAELKSKYLTNPEDAKRMKEIVNSLKTKKSEIDGSLEDSVNASEENASSKATPEEKQKIKDLKDGKDVSSIKDPNNDEAKSIKKDETAEEYNIRIAQQKIEGMKSALDSKKSALEKAKDTEKPQIQKVIDAIQKNIDKAQSAIDTAKDSTSENNNSDIWTINAMISIIENQLNDLDNKLFLLND